MGVFMTKSNTRSKQVDAEIVDMKQKAQCETDAQLARFLGKNQSTESQWRRRRSVPESAKKRLEFRLTTS
jgi:DNA-binding transcriptional regulator YiaG